MNFPEFEINIESLWVSIDYVRDFKAKDSQGVSTSNFSY